MFLYLLTRETISPVSLLTVLPRIVTTDAGVWGDVRGMAVEETVDRARQILAARSVQGRFGIASTPVAAEVAAQYGPNAVTYVAVGDDRLFLSRFLIEVLKPSAQLANFLDGAGIETCGDLARLTRESVEVRFGADGARLWRLARADDPRPIFHAIPRALPSASLEWTDYTLRRAERLLFVINGLCNSVCTMLRERGEGAVMLTLRFSLANQTAYEQSIRAARATASQTAWMRLLRLELERIVLPDAVLGIALDVTSIGPLGGKQGDVFDLGFGTAHAAEEAIAGLLDDQGSVVVEPENTLHPLLDRRTTWIPTDATQAIERHAGHRDHTVIPTLTLQLHPVPVRITVVTVDKHGVASPHTYRDHRQSYRIVEAAGPDRVSGGQWDEPYAREYYRCVNNEGMLVWLYRDVRTSAWYLHGWWD